MIPELTRERLERMRDGYTATGIWTGEDTAALLAHALSEPARLAAARAEGAAEMRDWVLRLIRGVRDDVQAKAAGDSDEAVRARHHMDALLALSIEVAGKTHMEVFDVLARARAEGVREGIEMAAKWHEARAAEHSRYATREASGQWTNGPALSEDAHRRYAETLRSLAPPPAEAPTTPTVEASTRCLRCNGSGIGQETMLCIRCGGSGEDPRRQSSQQTVKPAEARAPRAPDLVTAEGRTATATTATIRVQKARIAALEAKNEKLRERTAELEDGLRPFAKAGELFPPRTPDSFNEGVYRPAAGDEYAIGGDDLRRARALLRGQEVTP